MADNHKIRLYEPQFDDMWFRQLLLSDPETMSYNNAWGGTIQFTKDKWKDWFDHWVKNPCGERFYRYVTLDNSRIYIGEAAWHHDSEQDLWLVDVIIHSKYRHHGYGTVALKLLCNEAKKNGISVLHDDIAIDNPAVTLFLLFWRGRGGVLSGASFSEYLTAMSNFVPFATIRRYLASLRNYSVSSIIPIRNLVGNFILFMPFALIMHHFTKMKTAKLLVCTFGLLLAVEILQILTRTGSFDVDDIILNLLGAGLAYRIISRIDVKPREV